MSNPSNIVPECALSLVLPAFNEARNLESGLSYAAQALADTGRSFEIVVVDDGSTDDTAAVVRRFHAADPRIRLVQHPVNVGYGAAFRSGFDAAVGAHVMFTDADF
jgi:glycosyltransferase involved in cell wall biosynthesis